MNNISKVKTQSSEFNSQREHLQLEGIKVHLSTNGKSIMARGVNKIIQDTCKKRELRPIASMLVSFKQVAEQRTVIFQIVSDN
jgi:hypothetical protein